MMRRNRMRSERGAALLEAAFTIPLLLLISVGIFEFGRAYQQWQVLTNAVREGARLAVTPDVPDGDVTARVQDYMREGGMPEWAAATVTIVNEIPLGGSGTATQVTVAYPFEFIVLQPVANLVASGTGNLNALTMTAQALMRNEGS
jgi:Flp pilus assembly protein TadG